MWRKELVHSKIDLCLFGLFQDERRVEKEAWREERQQLEQQLSQLVESVKLLTFDNDRLLKVKTTTGAAAVAAGRVSQAAHLWQRLSAQGKDDIAIYLAKVAR